jgi:hypothetical protein
MAQTKNYQTIRYGNKDGELKFGHINEDNSLSAALIRSGSESLHYISLDATGQDHRKNGTICRSRGSFQVKAGDDVPDGKSGVFIDAVNGDLVLRAPNGRVRIEGVNIDIKASGSDNKNGVVTIESNEKVIINTQHIEMRSKVSTKIVSDDIVQIIGNAICDIYGGFVDIADGATTIKGSKGGSTNEDRARTGY